MKIYLINGESFLLTNEKINEIVGNSKNITTFDLTNSELQDVILEAGYFSMFEETKFIIVKNANFFCGDKLKDSETELLVNYLEQPNSNSVIIFICNGKLDLRKKATKTIKDKYSLITMPNLKYYEIENRIAEFLKKRYFTIEKETIKFIVANSLNNYDIAMSEINKIILYYNEPCHINRKDVNNIVAKSLNTNNFLFVDAIVDNDLEKSLSLLNDLKIMKVEPTVLIALIARDFRIMLNIKNLLAQNKREYEIMNELGLLDWQLEKYLNKIFPYKLKELENILLNLAKLDLDIKSGNIDRYIGLELFILDICG